MNFELFKELLENAVASMEERDAYCDQVPTDIMGTLIENAYTQSLQAELESVYRAVITDPDMLEDFYWFLYDWTPGLSLTYRTERLPIHSIQDFLIYIQDQYVLE